MNVTLTKVHEFSYLDGVDVLLVLDKVDVDIVWYVP